MEDYSKLDSAKKSYDYHDYEKQRYVDETLSSLGFQNNEFTLDTPYIQTQDDAENLMGWLINKFMKPTEFRLTLR
jgi:hypothetical protein